MNGFREESIHQSASTSVQGLSYSGGSATNSAHCNGPSGSSSTSSSGAVCCLLENGKRCSQPAISHVLSKRIQKTIAQKRLKILQDPDAVHSNICFYHRQQLVTPSRPDLKKKLHDQSDDRSLSDVAQVRLDQLPANTLRRFKKFFKLQTRPGMNKSQLADALQKAFDDIPVNEKEVITYFIYTVKTNRNKLDLLKSNDD